MYFYGTRAQSITYISFKHVSLRKCWTKNILICFDSILLKVLITIFFLRINITFIRDIFGFRRNVTFFSNQTLKHRCQENMMAGFNCPPACHPPKFIETMLSVITTYKIVCSITMYAQFGCS